MFNNLISLFSNFYLISQFPDLQPHIIFILADDLGWNEVSWHNPNMITPKLEVRCISV